MTCPVCDGTGEIIVGCDDETEGWTCHEPCPWCAPETEPPATTDDDAPWYLTPCSVVGCWHWVETAQGPSWAAGLTWCHEHRVQVDGPCDRGACVLCDRTVHRVYDAVPGGA